MRIGTRWTSYGCLSILTSLLLGGDVVAQSTTAKANPCTTLDTLVTGPIYPTSHATYRSLFTAEATTTPEQTGQFPMTEPSLTVDTLTCTPYTPKAAPAPKFGTPGTNHVVFVPLVGKALGVPEWFYILNLEVDHFFLQNTCVNLHLQGIYYDQPGPQTVGYGPAITLRRYFFVRPSGNLFLAGGVGLTYSDNPVPEVVGGKLNFTPRAAVGFTRELFGNTRLVGGLRVIHSQGLGRSDYARTILQPFLALSIVLH